MIGETLLDCLLLITNKVVDLEFVEVRRNDCSWQVSSRLSVSAPLVSSPVSKKGRKLDHSSHSILKKI
jgi:hypothetical protein